MLGKLRVGLNVLEVDIEVIGCVGKPIGTQIRWQQGPRVLGDIHTCDGMNRGDVFFQCQPPNPILM